MTFDRLPVEMAELIILETAVANWRTVTHTDVSSILEDLGNVDSCWSAVVSGTVFRNRLSDRIQRLVKEGKSTSASSYNYSSPS